MKKIVLIMLALLPAVLFAQTPIPDNFTLKSKVGTFNAPARAYLIYLANGKNVIDSAVLSNGEFKFHGNVPEPTSAYVVIDRAAVGLAKLQAQRSQLDILDLYLEKADIVLTTPNDSIAKAEISGSKLNAESKKLKALIKPIIDKGKTINDEYRNAPEAQQINPSFQDAIQAKFKAVQAEQTAAMKSFIAANPQSFVSLVALNSLNGAGLDVSETDGLYNSLAPAIKQTEAGKAFAGVIKELKVTAIGSPAPDFTQNDVNGGTGEAVIIPW